MIKDILRQVDYSLTAQISLLMFFGIFVVVALRTMFLSHKTCNEQANVVFDEEIKESDK